MLSYWSGGAWWLATETERSRVSRGQKLVGEEALRPAEERYVDGYWAGDDRPDPLVAQSAPEFVTQLRALVQWSGLTLEEIEQLARANGDILPPSIVSAALRHNTLPPEEVVVALVAAVGDDDEMVELWASVLWRLEEIEAATTMTPHVTPHVTPHMAPHSAPPRARPVSSVAGSRRYSGGSLAQAVQRRQNQNSWTGLHRGFQKGLRAKGFGSTLGRWTVPVAIGATIFVIVAGVAWAVARGGDEEHVAEPRSNPCCIGESGEATPSAGPEEEISPSAMTMVLPLPSSSTKASPTPKPSTAPPRNSPSPTQTQTQLNPSLSGSATGTCGRSGSNRVVDLTVTAVLTGAPAGNNPQGQAGKPGDPQQPFTLSGSGGISFSGQVSITVGPDTEPATGSIQWSVTVTVPGAGPVQASGSEPYSCSA